MSDIDNLTDNLNSAPANTDNVDLRTGYDVEGNADNSGQEQNNTEPDKFEGKDKDAVVDAYKELERSFGTLSNEIGDLRKSKNAYDDGILQFLKNQSVQPIEKPTPYATDEELQVMMQENPAKATAEITRKVTDSVLEKVQHQRVIDSDLKFQKKDSDTDLIVSSPDFQKWVRENVPMSMAGKSDELENKGDLSYLNYIVRNYKNSQKESGKVTNPMNTQKSLEAKKAGTLTGTGSGTGSNKKFLFTNEQLSKMPKDEYKAKNAQILKAYEEGRVG